MRRLRATPGPLAAVTALTAMAVTGCGLSSAATTGNIGGTPTGAPITVGISLPLTGGFAADGLASEQGYQLWASDVNAHGGILHRPVKLIIRNDNSDPNVTARDYQTLIGTDHVNFVMAPFSSLLTAAAIPVAAKHHYALIAGSAGAPSVYGSQWFFSTTVPVAIQMEPFAAWAASLPSSQRPRTAAYAMIDDPFADPPVETTEGFLSQHGVATVFYNKNKLIEPAAAQSKTDARIKAVADQVAASRAQLVVLGTVDVPSVQAFIEEFKKRGYQPKIVIASAGPDQGHAFIAAVGNDATGVMFPNGWYGGYPNALSRVMVQDYIAKFGGTASDINADVAEAYSCGEVLQAGVAAARGLDNTSIASFLHAQTVQTVVGQVRFDTNGENTDALNSALIFQWQQGQHLVQVLPATNPNSVKPLYPKPPWS